MNEDRAWFDANRPRAYDLNDPAERRRLLRETLGYAKVSLHGRDGTDLAGRRFAYEALRQALDGGLVDLAPMDGGRHP